MKKAEDILDEIYNLEKHKMTDCPFLSQLELIIDCIQEAQKDAIKASVEMARDYMQVSYDLVDFDKDDCEEELLKRIK